MDVVTGNVELDDITVVGSSVVLMEVVSGSVVVTNGSDGINSIKTEPSVKDMSEVVGGRGYSVVVEDSSTGNMMGKSFPDSDDSLSEKTDGSNLKEAVVEDDGDISVAVSFFSAPVLLFSIRICCESTLQLHKLLSKLQSIWLTAASIGNAAQIHTLPSAEIYCFSGEKKKTYSDSFLDRALRRRSL